MAKELPIISAVRDELANTQSLIDQARAHIHHHRRLFTEEQMQQLLARIDERQDRLDAVKDIVNQRFPK